MDPLGWINTNDDWTLRQKQTHFYILFSTRQLSVYRLKSRQMSPSWNTFSKPKKNGRFWYFMNQNKKKNTHVLDRTAKRHKWRPLREQDGNELGGRYSCVVTRAYVSKVKFTSGSRPRSSRPRILRSLIRGGRAPRAPPLDRPLMLRRKFNSLYWGFLIKGFVGGFTVSYNKSDVKITGF